MELKISEENVTLIQMCSFMFNVIIVLSNFCYLLFTARPNEVHPADDYDEYSIWLLPLPHFSSTYMQDGGDTLFSLKEKRWNI